jgi:hypothetical protein
MKKALTITALLLTPITISNCTLGPAYSTMQKRSMQTKTYEEPYNDVFKAFKTVLLDEGYIIKNQEFEGGLLLAEKGKTSGWFFGGGEKNKVLGAKYQISVNFDKISDHIVETRMNLQEITQYASGGTQSRELIKPETFQNIYKQVTVELERRKAKN